MYNPDDPMARRKRLAWSVATSCSTETGEPPVDIYNRILKKYEDADRDGWLALNESNETY